MSVLESSLARWGIGLMSSATTTAIELFLFDRTEQLVVFPVTAVALVGESPELKRIDKTALSALEATGPCVYAVC
jgi:hypothetical protein